jgi:hypothetical protein
MIERSVDTRFECPSPVYQQLDNRSRAVYGYGHSITKRLYWYLTNPDFMYSSYRVYKLTEKAILKYD